MTDNQDARTLPAVLTRSRIVSNFGEYALIILSQAVSVIFGFFGLRALTELLSPYEYGYVAIALTAITIAQQFAYGPLAVALSRFYLPAIERGNAASFEKATLFLTSITSAVVAVLSMLSYAVIRLVSDGPIPPSLAIGMLLLPVFSSYIVFIQLENAARRRAEFSVYSGLTAFARMLAPVIGCMILGCNAKGAIAGLVIFSVLSVGGLGFRWAGSWRKSCDGMGAIVKDVWVYQKPMLIWGAMTGIYMASDRWFLGIKSGPGEVALYVVLYQIGYYPVTMLTDTLNRFLQPILFQRAGNCEDPSKMRSAIRIVDLSAIGVALLTIVATIVAAVFHPLIFRIFVGPEFRAASSLLPYIVFASGLFSIGQMLSNVQMIAQSPTKLLPVKVWTAILGVFLNALLSLLFGLKGLIASLVAFSAIYLIWVLAIHKTHAKPC